MLALEGVKALVNALEVLFVLGNACGKSSHILLDGGFLLLSCLLALFEILTQGKPLVQGLGDSAIFKIIPAKAIGIERLDHAFPRRPEFLAQVFCAGLLLGFLADKAVLGHAGAVPLSSDLRQGYGRLFLLLFGLLQGLFQFLCLAYSGGKIPCKTLHVFPCCIPCIREFGVWLGRRIFLCECLRLRAKILQAGKVRKFCKALSKAGDEGQLFC